MGLLDVYRKWRGIPTDLELESFILADLPLGSERTSLDFYYGIAKVWPPGISLWRLYSKLDELEEEGLVRSRWGQPTPERGNRRPKIWRISSGGRRAKTPHVEWSGNLQPAYVRASR
jgi:hypothetical protein